MWLKQDPKGLRKLHWEDEEGPLPVANQTKRDKEEEEVVQLGFQNEG